MLSGNINIEDDDWDSVRQGYAALTRDLERIYLSYGLGGNDFGGGTPKSANDQTVMQDGNYGYQAVTTDMLDDLEARFNEALDAAIPSIPAVTYPISIANGGTGQITQQLAINALAGAVTKWYGLVGDSTNIALRKLPVSGTRKTTYTSGSGNFTVPAGVYFISVVMIAGGGGKASADSVTASTFYVAATSGGVVTAYMANIASSGAGGSGGACVLFIPVTPGDVMAYVVGAGGGDNSNGSSSTFGGATAYGGQAGGLATQSGRTCAPGNAGRGGNIDIGNVAGVPVPGRNGSPGLFGSAGALPNAVGGPGIIIAGTEYGKGGYPSNAASRGAIAIFY